MIPFKINGSTYKIPSTWNDVTYAQYLALIRPTTIADQIAIFTGIPRETIEKAELKNLEKIGIALSFLYVPPDFQKTNMIGPYYAPDDVTIQSTAQFESLRGLLIKMPKDLKTVEGSEAWSDLCLHACAIYCQKIRDREFNAGRAEQMKEELKKYSCVEVIGNGSFFLFKPLNTSKNITGRSRNILRRLKKWIQDLPGYRKTLDSLQPSSARRGR
jgi:hypothetical protein